MEDKKYLYIAYFNNDENNFKIGTIKELIEYQRKYNNNKITKLEDFYKSNIMDIHNILKGNN